MPKLDVLAYAFSDESASLAAYQAVMALVEGGSAYRLHTPGGEIPPIVVVFAFSNVDQLRAACVAAGGIVTSIEPQLLHDLTARSLHAAQHGIKGRRHHAPGTRADRELPSNPNDYTPRDA